MFLDFNLIVTSMQLCNCNNFQVAELFDYQSFNHPGHPHVVMASQGIVHISTASEYGCSCMTRIATA